MGSDTEKHTYYRYGVAVLQPVPALYTNDGNNREGDFITSPAIESLVGLKEGDCFQVEFIAGLDELPANKTYQAELTRLDTVPLWPLHTELTDTAGVWAEEEYIKLTSFSKSRIIRNRFFLLTDHSPLIDQEKHTLDLSYDPEELQLDTLSGIKYYNLFLRSTRHSETTDTIGTKWVQANAFDFAPFIRRQKEVGADSLYFRINYPSKLNANKSGYLWERTGMFAVKLSELPE
ncbi:hypothetical protein D0T51_01785 [Parabacteroides sp. 52]|nr:hypothetical protein [Parabacteroides sp. 52]